MNQEFRFAQKGIVLDKNKTKILVHKYTSALYNNDKLAGKLGLPGGRMEFGEDIEEHFLREIKEETGVLVKPSIPIYTWTWKYQKGDKEVQIIANARLALYLNGELKEAEGEDENTIEKTFWIDIPDLKAENFIFDEWPAIEIFLKLDKSIYN